MVILKHILGLILRNVHCAKLVHIKYFNKCIKNILLFAREVIEKASEFGFGEMAPGTAGGDISDVNMSNRNNQFSGPDSVLPNAT